ncbi:MAG TPA: histidine kinase, partial [Myxococcaceae bacterium]|nr:histidine kinase [Myxococcaceae bacterium]
MQPSTPARAPLARSALIHMGVRIAVIIALSTLLSYLHMYSTLRTGAVAQLEQHVSERSQREQAIFLLAHDNHGVLKQALEERIRALTPEEVSARFDELFVRLPDGTIRNRPERFDGTRMVGVFVPQGVPVDADLRRRILAAYDVLLQFGPSFRTRFATSFITLPEGPNIAYWPDRPTYAQDAAPTESIIAQDFFPLTLPEHNPQRATAWSGVYLESVSGKSMTTVSTPLDMDGRHVASVSHDVLLDELVTRTRGDHLPEAYNLIFREDGGLIVQPEQKEAEASSHVRDIIERVKSRGAEKGALELPEYGEYVAVTRL